MRDEDKAPNILGRREDDDGNADPRADSKLAYRVTVPWAIPRVNRMPFYSIRRFRRVSSPSELHKLRNTLVQIVQQVQSSTPASDACSSTRTADRSDRVLTLLDPPGQHLKECLRRLDALRHVDEFMADHLVFAERLAESPALARISDRFVEANAGERRARRGHAEPLIVEIEHDRLEACAFFADEVLRRHAAILEVECRGV